MTTASTITDTRTIRDKGPVVHSREDIDEVRPSDAQDRPCTVEEALEEGLRDSMDASDPLSITQPGDHGDPVPSSGFTEETVEKAGH